MPITTKCGSCGGSVEATPVDTSQIAAGSLQPVTNACTCAQPTVCEPSCPTASPCEEDHCKETVINNFSATVKTTTSFNFPSVGSNATVKLSNVTSLIPGQILWNQGVGRLHVLSYDAVTREATLTNLGDSCTITGAAVGELIQSCTEFGVSIPECNLGGGGGGGTAGPFLAADFVAPGNGNCALAKVTTVQGLALNDIVSIAGFQYRINGIPDAETIELCDEGEGAPLGQVIEWDPNCDEVPDIPVLVLSGENPCAQTPEASGKIVVCNDSSQLTTLAGSQTGQSPVWDQDLEKFTLVNLNLDDQCTFLTACLVVDIGDDGPYIAIVDDSSFFTIGQQVTIDNDVFLIDNIPSPTQLRLIPDVTPPAIKEYAEGLQVCLRDCCAYLPQKVQDICDTLEGPCFPNGVLESVSSPPINVLSTRNPAVPAEEISATMTDRYYTNPDDLTLASYTNNTECQQLVECNVSVVHSVKIAANDEQAMSDFALFTSTDMTSLLPRVIHYFDSTGHATGFGNPQPAGSFPLLAQWDWLNVHTGHTQREIVAPGATIDFIGKHFILFDVPGGNNPPTANVGFFLFVHGHVKVYRLLP